MAKPPASPWSRAAGGMRQRVDAAIDRMADAIKEALLDGLEFPDDEEVTPAPLVPLPPDRFVERMRERVEKTLRQVAEVLNAAPDDSPAAIEEKTCDLFTVLWLESLQVAAQLRLEETLVEEQPEVELPQGEWARRYRRMIAEDQPDEGIR
ncbi:MAG TPA: hypothetical protein VKA46_01575 [Gemmataceae bacterium]|nr:hypothetical protein [Gemmataceae bacterium]